MDQYISGAKSTKVAPAVLDDIERGVSHRESLEQSNIRGQLTTVSNDVAEPFQSIPADFSKLPNEIKFKIIEKLNDRDISRFAQAHTEHEALVQTYYTFKQHFNPATGQVPIARMIDAGISNKCLGFYIAAHPEEVKWTKEEGEAAEQGAAIRSKKALLYTALASTNIANYNTEAENTAFALMLIRNGVNLDCCPFVSKETPFHVATNIGYVEVVQELLNKNVDVNDRNNEGETPLHKAAAIMPFHKPTALRYLQIVQILLLNKNVDVNSRDRTGETPLHKAAERGNLQVVQALLLNKNVDVNSSNSDDETPLHKAAARGHLQVVQALLNKNADVNSSNRTGETPLHKAAKRGSLQIVQALLDNNADVNSSNRTGETPLHKAAKRRSNEIVYALIKKGADIYYRNELGFIPRDYMSSYFSRIKATYLFYTHR